MNMERTCHFTWSRRGKFLHWPLLHREDGYSIHILLVLLWLMAASDSPAAIKAHTVFLGSGKSVPYSVLAIPPALSPPKSSYACVLLLSMTRSGNGPPENHTPITDRSFVVRRALRLNDALPGDKAEHWIWQRGPWLMIDRVKGSVTALHLPDYDPAVSTSFGFATMPPTAA